MLPSKIPPKWLARGNEKCSWWNEWLAIHLLSSIQELSVLVLVLDNALYHTQLTEESWSPTTATKKDDIVRLLQHRNISIPHGANAVSCFSSVGRMPRATVPDSKYHSWVEPRSSIAATWTPWLECHWTGMGLHEMPCAVIPPSLCTGWPTGQVERGQIFCKWGMVFSSLTFWEIWERILAEL